MAKMRVCERHNNELKYYCYDHKEELCDTCWREKHVDHKIELIELFQWRQLSPAWERRELAVSELVLSNKESNDHKFILIDDYFLC